MKLYRNAMEKLKTVVEKRSSIVICLAAAAIMSAALCIGILATTGSNLQADRTEFDKNSSELNHEDVTVFYQLEDGWELEIGLQTKELNTDGSTVMQSLQEGTDYTIENDSVLLRKEYLATLEDGQQTFCFTAREVPVEVIKLETGDVAETEQVSEPKQRSEPGIIEEKLVLVIMTTVETELVTESVEFEEDTAEASKDTEETKDSEEAKDSEKTEEIDESKDIEEAVSILENPTSGESEESVEEEIVSTARSSLLARDESDFEVSMKWVTTDESKHYDMTWASLSADTQTFTFSLTIKNGASEYAVGDMEIRIPYILWTDRYGNDVVPSAYGIPKSPNVAGAEVPFNYSIDTETNEIVIKNYGTVSSASNIIIQITYSISPSATIDMSKGTLQAKATAKNTEGEAKTDISNEITLTIDTGVELTSFTNELETLMYYWDSTYVAYLEEKPADFNDYCYVVYKTDTKRTANQRNEIVWSVNPNNGGKLAGYKYGNYITLDVDYDAGTITMSPSQFFSNQTLYIIVRYPRAEIDSGNKQVTNTVTVQINPSDGIDPPVSKSATVRTTWVDYSFHYDGDVIGIKKSRDNTVAPHYTLTALKNGYDAGLLHWRISTTVHGYNLSTYSVEMIDDFMDWKTDSGTMVQMTADDYEHTRLQVYVNNYQIDKATGEITYPNKSETDAGEIEVFALVKGSSEFQLLGTYCVNELKWGPSTTEEKVITVNLPEGTYQVKLAAKNIKDYLELSGYLYTNLKAASPTIQQWLEEDIKYITVRNYDAAKLYNKDGKWINITDESNYSDSTSEYGQMVVQRDLDTYGNYIQRDTNSQNAYGVSAVTSSGKVVTDAVNDTTKRQATVLFGLYAYDYYEYLNNSENVEKLIEMGIELSREEMVFYDLLPLGMYYDTSYEAIGYDIGGKTTNVKVDWETIDDFKGTGRQMVIFRVSTITEGTNYVTSGSAYIPKAKDKVLENYSVYNSSSAAGFQVRFRAITNWEDIATANRGINLMVAQVPNICKGDKGAADAGNHGTNFTSVKGEDGNPVFYDINGDGDITTKNIIGASSCTININVTLALEEGLTKSVKAAEAAASDSYQKEALAMTGSTYTYRLMVQNNDNNYMSDVVLFDILESAAQNDENSWKGTFNSISEIYATNTGIRPTVYYSTVTGLTYDALYSSGGYTAIDNMLRNSGDWTTTVPADKASITAIAIDLSKAINGTKFRFEPNSGTSILIHMDSPEEMPEATYAYNQASYYSSFVPTTGGTTEMSHVVGIRTTVEIGYEQSLIKTSDPAGGSASEDATLVEAGDIVTYTITFDPGHSAQNIVIKDSIPNKMYLVAGSITYTLQDGITRKVDETNTDYYRNREITWPTYNQDKAGKATFSFQVLVSNLNIESPIMPGYVLYYNRATATIDKKVTTSNYVTHKRKLTEADIKKTAALIVDVDYENDDLSIAGNPLTSQAGSQTLPVGTELGQLVEYTMTVTHKGAKSGQYIVTDKVPEGTTLVSNSITGSVNGVTITGSESDGVITWVMNEMDNTDYATLKFRVLAPVETDIPETQEYEFSRIFTNTAHLYDVRLSEIKYKEDFNVYIDSETPVSYEKGTNVFPDYEKDSETTYHQVVKDFCNLTITKVLTEASDEQQQFVFAIEHLNDAGDTITFYQLVRVPAKEITASVNIINLSPGTYTITELESNWRYTIDAEENMTQTITLKSPEESYEVIFTNKLTNDIWVGGKDSVTNSMPDLKKE